VTEDAADVDVQPERCKRRVEHPLDQRETSAKEADEDVDLKRRSSPDIASVDDPVVDRSL
jgi:hypothetical protein